MCRKERKTEKREEKEQEDGQLARRGDEARGEVVRCERGDDGSEETRGFGG